MSQWVDCFYTRPEHNREATPLQSSCQLAFHTYCISLTTSVRVRIMHTIVYTWNQIHNINEWRVKHCLICQYYFLIDWSRCSRHHCCSKGYRRVPKVYIPTYQKWQLETDGRCHHNIIATVCLQLLLSENGLSHSYKLVYSIWTVECNCYIYRILECSLMKKAPLISLCMVVRSSALLVNGQDFKGVSHH